MAYIYLNICTKYKYWVWI